MPTVFSHGIAAAAMGKVFASGRTPLRFWVLSILCAMLPDVDALGFALGIRYGDMLGHRGLTHSLFFAALVSVLVVAAFFRRDTLSSAVTNERLAGFQFSSGRIVLIVYFFLVTASHGILDALTNGGLGIAFFAPFSSTRYFFPWRPIEVSPIGFDFFSSARTMGVILSEIEWIWIPSAVIMAAAQFRRTIYKR